jgi:hypothetical protein
VNERSTSQFRIAAMPKQKRADKLKNKGDKRRRTDNLEVVLREDLAQNSGIVQPKPPRAPKQRSRADSDDELDEAEQKKIETMARAQASDELQRGTTRPVTTRVKTILG